MNTVSNQQDSLPLERIRKQFLLSPDVVFLNHGSFGACPVPVLEAYQEWQRRLERQPVQFLTGELSQHLEAARSALAEYLKVDAADLVYIPNATFGVNLIARSLALGPQDEVLSTDHEYGACDYAWQFMSRKRGFHYRQQPVPLPAGSAAEITEQFWQGVTSKTRVIFLSHITSPTALQLPVADICRRAREAGILTVVDGAHAPGQIPLDLAAIDADFYTGNAHKWMCAPKGSAFLYARRDRQHLVEPLVVSWGWGDGAEVSFGSRFLDYLQWTGTNDPAAYLSVPAAIQFQAEYGWPAIRQRCQQMAIQALRRICGMTGLSMTYQDAPHLQQQMVVAPLPHIQDLQAFKKRFYETYRVEVPFVQWQDRQFVRISVQGYNSEADIDALCHGLEAMLAAA